MTPNCQYPPPRSCINNNKRPAVSKMLLACIGGASKMRNDELNDETQYQTAAKTNTMGHPTTAGTAAVISYETGTKHRSRRCEQSDSAMPINDPTQQPNYEKPGFFVSFFSAKKRKPLRRAEGLTT